MNYGWVFVFYFSAGFCKKIKFHWINFLSQLTEFKRVSFYIISMVLDSLSEFNSRSCLLVQSNGLIALI